MGHTHQPDDIELSAGGRYLKPGSWTSYLELTPGARVTFDDLRDERRYPYHLNWSARMQRSNGCSRHWTVSNRVAAGNALQ